MGYYTKYELMAAPDIQEVWDAVKENDNIKYAVGNDGYSGQPCKWYEHEDCMVEFSKKFPHVTFSLRGEGEESADIWVKHFRNGKKQRCNAEIIIQPMNENNWI